MPRKPRIASPTNVYHFIARGVNKKKLFHKDEDYKAYLTLAAEQKARFDLKVYHYCLMPNHIHLVLDAPTLKSLASFGHFVHRRYAYYYCKSHQWSEQVFRRNFRSIPITHDNQLLECGRYVERNPLKAKLVNSLDDHWYSSFRYYAQGQPDDLVSSSPAYLGLAGSEGERRIVYTFYAKQERLNEVDALS